MSKNQCVGSLSEFCQHVVDIFSESLHARFPEVSAITFYRGQANKEWGLIPRLYRENLFNQERALLEELMRISPQEFSGLNNFSKLVKMQHYGLPTRLLDMTINPLVALFFACYDNNQIGEDGKVFIFPTLPVYRSHSYAVELITTFIYQFSAEYIDIDTIMNYLSKNELLPDKLIRDDSKSTVMYFLTELSYMAILPSTENKRISKQDGAFFLLGMEELKWPDDRNKTSKSRKRIGPKILHNELTDIWHLGSSVIVPANKKERILDELNLMGISASKLFPELEYQTHYVTDLVKSGGAFTGIK